MLARGRSERSPSELGDVLSERSQHVIVSECDRRELIVRGRERVLPLRTTGFVERADDTYAKDCAVCVCVCVGAVMLLHAVLGEG